MWINKIASTRLRLWTLTNVIFTIVVTAVCLLETFSLYTKTGETLTLAGIYWADVVLVAVLWCIGNIILYVVLDTATFENRHLTYFNKVGRWHWIPITALAVIINSLVGGHMTGPIAITDLIFHTFTKMGWFLLLYPLVDAAMSGLMYRGEKGTWRDNYYIHRIGNTRAWRRWCLHLGELDWDISLLGFGWPEVMITLDPDGEEIFHLWVHLGLFGFGFASSRLPYVRSRHFKGRYRLGFYSCSSHIRFSFLENEDYLGWTGGGYYQVNWERVFKGEESVERTEERFRGSFVLDTKEREGYEKESIKLNVASTTVQVKYSRWKNPPLLEAYHVWTDRDVEVARVPGKGENGWDCDDEYGIDLFIGSRPIGEFTPIEAANYAIDHLDEQRSRR